METDFFLGNDAADELARRAALLLLSAVLRSLSALASRSQSPLLSNWRHMVLFKLIDTQTLLVSTEELVLPRQARCLLTSSLQWTQPSDKLFISLKLAQSRSLDAAPVAIRLWTFLISFCTVQLRTLCVARSLVTLDLFMTSGPSHKNLPGFWSSMVFRHALIPRKRSISNNNTKSLYTNLTNLDNDRHSSFISLPRSNRNKKSNLVLQKF